MSTLRLKVILRAIPRSVNRHGSKRFVTIEIMPPEIKPHTERLFLRMQYVLKCLMFLATQKNALNWGQAFFASDFERFILRTDELSSWIRFEVNENKMDVFTNMHSEYISSFRNIVCALGNICGWKVVNKTSAGRYKPKSHRR
jgi:hypothetical protein